MRREAAIIVYPGFQLLDAAGPITAFEVAERHRPGNCRPRSWGLQGALEFPMYFPKLNQRELSRIANGLAGALATLCAEWRAFHGRY